MTNERGLNETPEERAARIQAAKDRALAARRAREAGEAPPAPAATAPAEAEAPVAEAVIAAAPAPVEDDRPRTAAGTLKRDPNEPKKEAPATPEERRARVEAAKAAAAAARAQREAGGGAVAAGRPGATAQPSPDEAADEAIAAAAAPVDDGDGRPRTLKGTLKRDPNEAKKEPPKTPEERAARVAAAKAAAAAAREAAKSRPAAAAGAAPSVAAVARPAARGAAEDAAFRQAFEAVTRPLPGAAHPPLRPIPAAAAARPGALQELSWTEAQEATVAAFRQALDGVQFEAVPTHTDALLIIDRADVLAVMRAAKEHPALEMKFLRCITGVDQMPEGIEVVYGLKSLTTKHAVSIKTLLPAHDPVVDSVTSVWLGANWHERELMEMFGVRCAGHPDPRNLLLDEDMTIHPLLKAHPLQDVELKQGVNVF
jgi:NADH-quinone oxidoreductase subunit C